MLDVRRRQRVRGELVVVGLHEMQPELPPAGMEMEERVSDERRCACGGRQQLQRVRAVPAESPSARQVEQPERGGYHAEREGGGGVRLRVRRRVLPRHERAAAVHCLQHESGVRGGAQVHGLHRLGRQSLRRGVCGSRQAARLFALETRQCVPVGVRRGVEPDCLRLRDVQAV